MSGSGARSWIGPNVYPVFISNRVNRNQRGKVGVQSWYQNMQDTAATVFHYCQYRGWCLPYNHDHELRDRSIVLRPASPDKRESRPPFVNFCKIYLGIVNGAFYVCELFLWKKGSGFITFILCSPDKISLRSFPKPLTSCKAVVTLSRAPNKLSRPRVRSIRKNMIDQKVAPGIWFMASVNAMNTSPGPLAACWINVQVISQY